MCCFFGFVSYDNVFYYINAEDRKKKLLKNPDSHTQICSFFNLPEDRCNKYEFSADFGITADALEYKDDDPEGFIKKMLPKLVEMAIATIKTYGEGIEFLSDEERTQEICLALVKKNCDAIRHLTDKQRTPEVCIAAVKKDGNAIVYLTNKQRTPMVCLAAVQKNGDAIRFLTAKQRTPKVCKEAVKKAGWTITYLTNEQKTLGLCMLSVEKSGTNIEYVPNELRTPKLCLTAVLKDKAAFKFLNYIQKEEVAMALLKRVKACKKSGTK